jgi:diketogulonate reductase-like aldo/keto reductase
MKLHRPLTYFVASLGASSGFLSSTTTRSVTEQVPRFFLHSTLSKRTFLSTPDISAGAVSFGATLSYSVQHPSKRPSIIRRRMAQASKANNVVNCPTITLSNGMNHPAIGFGTYKVGYVPASASSAVASGVGDDQAGKERTAEECVSDALSVGYRFLECAEFYNNECSIGKAIASSGIVRDELFLCSKVWTTTIEKGPDAIRAQLDKTLKDLGTDYLDMYLVHWPVPGHHVTAYNTLVEFVKEGKVKSIGLSNYAVEDYQELKDQGALTEIAPVVNQIEINPFLYRKETIDFFTKEGVVLQSYRSLKDGKAFTNPVLLKVATSHGKSTAQILGRWCVQKGFVYMPKSVKKERMVENSCVFDFDLTVEEMKELDALTTPEALDNFLQLYRKCVNRDTTKDGTLDGVKMDITIA